MLTPPARDAAPIARCTPALSPATFGCSELTMLFSMVRLSLAARSHCRLSPSDPLPKACSLRSHYSLAMLALLLTASDRPLLVMLAPLASEAHIAARRLRPFLARVARVVCSRGSLCCSPPSAAPCSGYSRRSLAILRLSLAAFGRPLLALLASPARDARIVARRLWLPVARCALALSLVAFSFP